MSQVERSLDAESPDVTSRLGELLGGLLESGDFIGLTGELGAGKTHFVRGLASGAGVSRSGVSSPSFAIVATYPGRLPLHHADLYRLADEDELFATGFFDLVGGEGAVVVEWLERVPRAAPPDALLVRFEVLAPERRRLHARATGERSARLLQAWEALSRGDRPGSSGGG